jgi:peptide/histidine transporter 3/4
MAKEASSLENESLTDKSMEPVVAFHSTGTKMHNTCCKSLYQKRKLKNKGAIVVIVWNFLVSNLAFYLANHASDYKPYFVAYSFVLPFAGWLADVYLGRYKVIRWSMWIMWVGSVLATVSSVVAQMVNSYQHFHTYISLALLIIASIGLGGFWANVIQFGLDQLQDASTTEITAFISWFIWINMSGGVALHSAYACIKEEYHIVGQLYVCICLSMALILIFLTKNLLAKEPVTQNPFKLVYRVIKFAIKNKHPRCRSAFTYCEDELPSRLDLGKHKYGGPFTTEQVEDVKTFLRLLTVVFFGCAIPSVVITANRFRGRLLGILNEPSIECYLKIFYVYTDLITATILVPLHEFFLYPLLHKYFSWVKSYWKFSIGVVAQAIRVIALMVMELMARNNYLAQNGNNSTLQCIFSEENGALSSSFDLKWMVLPNILNSISIVTLGIGGIEFICAQTPYSMKGLMVGTVYGGVVIISFIGYGVSELFTRHMITWSTGVISCGFWFLLLVIIVLIFNSTLLLILGKLYKNRKREDVLPNEHIFAERYYSDTDT